MILRIENLSKYYGKTKGIEDFSLELKEGEIFGLIGPNGAGKSTTIRSVMDLINRTKGRVYFEGEELTRDNVDVKRQIGYLPGEVFLYEGMTVAKMFDYHQSFYHQDLKERREYLSSRLHIDETKKVEDLSLGNRKKVGIVLALMHMPKLVILDEPTSGLDPIMQKEFYELLKEEKQRGTAMIYSTHILSEVSQICDRVGIVRDGHLIRCDSVETLAANTLQYVTVKSAQADVIVKAVNAEVLNRDGNTVRFKYDRDINTLIGILAEYPVDRLQIEEPSIDDIFMHYYQ
ncbi:MAG: ATP-binding cassette domain-containing protein [Bulleidia sp.]